MHRISWIPIAAVLAALLLSGCPAKQQGSDTTVQDGAAVSSPDTAASNAAADPAAADSAAVGGQALANAAADISFSSFDNTPHKLSDYRGKPVVLNFWADW